MGWTTRGTWKFSEDFPEERDMQGHTLKDYQWPELSRYQKSGDKEGSWNMLG